jgi:glucose-6-phosphate isomerase
MLTYHSDRLYADKIGSLGITGDSIAFHSQRKQEAKGRFADNIHQNKYGFVNIVRSPDLVQLVNEVLKQVEWATTLVVIGIGGSELGGSALQQALERDDHNIKVVFYGDTTDPNSIDALLKEVDLGSTVFNIVSKSGGTLETLSFYIYLKSILQARSQTWHKHFVFTTGSETGALGAEMVKYEDILHLPVPDDVGGRFSVLSPVGLLPAAAMGIDIRQLVAGAESALENLLSDINKDELQEPLACKLAWEQFLLHEQGIRTSVLWVYSSKLGEFGNWYRQLWAESLGKDGKGILPVVAEGPSDQHSQLQLYTQGTPAQAHLFLLLRNHGASHIIKNVDLEDFSYLVGKDFAEIINAEGKATADSLANASKPVATLELDGINAFTLGELFMTFELAVTFLGELLQVNAFDQPGVEESKRLIKEILSR